MYGPISKAHMILLTAAVLKYPVQALPALCIYVKLFLGKSC